jgi:hypothetical protein
MRLPIYVHLSVVMMARFLLPNFSWSPHWSSSLVQLIRIIAAACFQDCAFDAEWQPSMIMLLTAIDLSAIGYSSHPLNSSLEPCQALSCTSTTLSTSPSTTQFHLLLQLHPLPQVLQTCRQHRCQSLTFLLATVWSARPVVQEAMVTLVMIVAMMASLIMARMMMMRMVIIMVVQGVGQEAEERGPGVQ